MDAKQPRTIGRYQITGELGRGGMGVVWSALDPSLDRRVAIKLIRIETDSQTRASDVEQRFLREARVAARLTHPGIATIYDAGREADALFLVMELVPGESLARRLADGRFPSMSESLDIAAQVADALVAAHAAGIVHRDIKPGNILLTSSGQVKVSDFGVAKAVGESTELTRTGTVIGSPAYMAPEQIQGAQVDGRADVFSLGVVLYELLLRRRPFPADTMTTLIYQVLHQDPFQDGAALQAVGPELSGFLRSALAKQPGARIPDARVFAARVRELSAKLGGAGGAGVAPTVILAPSRPEPAAPPAAPPPSYYEPPPVVSAVAPLGSASGAPPRHRVGLAVGLAALGVAALLGILFVLRRPQPPPSLAQGSVVAPATTAGAREPAASDRLPAEGGADRTAGGEDPRSAAARSEAPAGLSPREGEPDVGVVVRQVPPPQERTPPVEPAAPVAAPESAPTAPSRPAQTAPQPVQTASAPPIAVAANPAVQSAEPAPPPSKPQPAPKPAPAPPPLATFQCSQTAEFHVSPEETLVTIEGRTIGTADDWDGRGGGKVYKFPSPGSYDVRLALEGHVTAHVRIVVSADAEEETCEVDTELQEVEEVEEEEE